MSHTDPTAEKGRVPTNNDPIFAVKTAPGEPLYLQLRERLRQELLGQVKSRFIVQGQLMPEAQIAQTLGVSRGTVRQAILDLRNEGLLVRRRGHGTQVVRQPLVEQDLNRLEGLGEILLGHGITSQITVLHHDVVELPLTHPAVTALNTGPQLYYLERLRCIDDIPIAIDRSYFANSVGLALERYDICSNSIYEVLENELGIAMGDADEWVRALKSTREIAEVLHIQAGFPVLFLEKIVYDRTQKPLESATSIYPGDLFRYRIRAHRSTRV